MLFCPGLPGAGKTVLAAIAIHHLQNLFGNDSNIGIAYHYCDFGHRHNETDNLILSSILKQLAQCSGSLPDAMSTLYSKHKDKGTRPSLREIASALKTVACLHSRIFIVIDGLDECLVWRDVMAQLRGLQGANILATSRAIPDIANDPVLKGSSILEVHARGTDVRKYLNRNMSELSRFVMRDQQLQEDICNAILGASGGMFLLARLHLNSLEGKLSVGTLRDALTALPTGALAYDEAYDEAYDDAMKRIESQHRERTAIAKDVLAWLTFAKRPLRVEELRTAVIVQETDSHLDEERLMDIEDMVSVCAGLVEIDEKNDRVTLIHNTTKEYLKRTREKWRPDADAAIATSCLTYLLFRVFDVESSEIDECLQREKAGRQLYPLLDYSMEYSALHARLALLLERRASLDSDIENMTPLHYTVKNGDEAIAQTFLSAGTPVDTLVVRQTYIPTYQEGRVIYVIGDSEKSVAQNSRTVEGLTTLHLAALTGSQRMTKFLLDHGANPNFPSDSGETPLHLALRRDLYGPKWPGIVDFWNDPDNRVECVLDYIELDDDEDEYCSTQDWIQKERLAILDLLLENPEVDVDAQDMFGISSLHIAAGSKDLSESITQKLIDKGATISLSTKENKTPLHFAVMNGNLGVVSNLLTLGADPTDEDVNGLNALHYAAQKGHLQIMQDVLSRVPDFLSETFLGSKDKNGQNVWHHLLSNDGPVDIAVARYLLERFNDINELDSRGMSPMAIYLSAFVLCEYQDDQEILDLMFKYGADPEFKTSEGLGLAHLAARSRRLSVSVLRILASWGVNLKSRDEQGRTALHHSSIKGTLSENVLHFLCEDVQLSVDLRDVHGNTALDYAVEMGQQDHDPNIIDPDRWVTAGRLLRGV
ncbi:Ankyrin-2 [Fusarium oxysporum f. sp. raphani]|uniref:Ankyrin-2 n=1 Tax=Fusarium oxysporum f. sp. raphani TaxID=96318 RepID=A0A8J5U632_FUSOX|nr:Ankyrin-2 [Fusarium oxysporum f. sp. raphani]